MQGKKEKIAVVLPNHLGDVVMATPALRALRKSRPKAEIVGVVQASLAPALRGAPWIDHFVEHRIYEPRGLLKRIARRLSIARELRGCDPVIVLPNSFSSALLALASGARRRVGYRRNVRSWLLSQPLAAPRERWRFRPMAMERYYLDLVQAIGCPDTGTNVELFTEPEAERECEARFTRHGVDHNQALVCLAPGAGYGPSKLWPLAYFAELASGLLAAGVQVALIHAPDEDQLADEILRRATPGLLRLGGPGMDLSLLKSVISRASLLVCNDAGARHIAAAFEIPTLVLIGPTSIHYTNLNLKRTRLLREPVDCAPCQLKVCPTDHRCMTRLRPLRVLEEAHLALNHEGWRGSVELELAP